MEIREEAELIESQAKMNIFASNPSLYEAMFIEEQKEIEDDIDWVVPRSQEDLDWIMEEMRKAP
jgi:hypothetical protein